MHGPECPRSTGLQIVKYNDRRAEQSRIHGVEIVVRGLEQRKKGLSVSTRGT